MNQQTALQGFVDQFIFPHEGETWENDPDDEGNLGDSVTAGNIGTKFGIDARSHPGIDIVNLDRTHAELIYWNEYNTSLAGRLRWPLAPTFFDVHVNNGETRGIKILQKILGVTQDGLVGPVTMGRIAVCDPIACALSIPAARDLFYESIAEAAPGKRKYLHGWENRDRDLVAWVQQHRGDAVM